MRPPQRVRFSRNHAIFFQNSRNHAAKISKFTQITYFLIQEICGFHKTWTPLCLGPAAHKSQTTRAMIMKLAVLMTLLLQRCTHLQTAIKSEQKRFLHGIFDFEYSFFMSLDTGYSLLARIFLEIPIQFRKSDKAKKNIKNREKREKPRIFFRNLIASCRVKSQIYSWCVCTVQSSPEAFQKF